MTGPEHYKEAQDLVAAAYEVANIDREHGSLLVAQAQVHATLALAAATALPAVAHHFYDDEHHRFEKNDADWAVVVTS